ncbi:MAG: response regulator transcription factor [Candidatus Thiodiazotropha sp. (ex Notomyrtea botanica)]|nr:response regulator transcription factor [Candidatus Thiodiazotropha sp. (ex Notomyrtea botanica)]
MSTIYVLLLDSAPEIEVVAEAERGEEACQRFAELHPDVVVMDLSLPGIGGLEAIRRIVARDSEAAILVFSMHDDTAFVEKALAVGARGFITKNSAAEIMIDAIRTVASGEAFIDQELAQNLAIRKASGGSEVFACLTTREFQISSLLAHGLLPAETASELTLSYKTVANYTTQIKSKLSMKSSTELV